MVQKTQEKYIIGLKCGRNLESETKLRQEIAGIHEQLIQDKSEQRYMKTQRRASQTHSRNVGVYEKEKVEE